MHNVVIALLSAGIASAATHYYKAATADTAETIARDFAEARAKVKSTVDGAKALVEKLEKSL